MNKFNHLDIKKTNAPYDVGCKFSENSNWTIAYIEYASAIGTLLYAMHCTKPNIAFVVCKLSRYTSKPNVEHWKAIARVLGYL